MEYKLSKEEHRNRLERVKALEPLLKLPTYTVQQFNIGRDSTGAKLYDQDMRTIVLKCRGITKDRDGKVIECPSTTMGAVSIHRHLGAPVIVAMNCDICRCGYNVIACPIERDNSEWGIQMDISYKYFPVRSIDALLGEN